MFKSVVFHERRPELSRAQFMDHWLNTHAPMSNNAKHLHGYICGEVLNEVVIPDMASFQFEASIDGVAQMWFEQEDGLVTLPQQPSVKLWFADGPNFIGRRTRFMADEKLIIPPLRPTGADLKLIILLARNEHDNDGAFQGNLESACKGLGATRFGKNGLTISRIVSSPISTSVATFPTGKIVTVIEAWPIDLPDANNVARGIIRTLVQSKASSKIEGARSFLTMDYVIRRPTH